MCYVLCECEGCEEVGFVLRGGYGGGCGFRDLVEGLEQEVLVVDVVLGMMN